MKIGQVIEDNERNIFGQVIEDNKRNVFLQKSYRKWAGDKIIVLWIRNRKALTFLRELKYSRRNDI